MEYANQVWFPHLVKAVEAIENVQRATRLLLQLKFLIYKKRLKELNLPTLFYRRSRGDMIDLRFSEECMIMNALQKYFSGEKTATP